MLGVGRAAPAQFPAAGREFTRHSARGPEGPLGDFPTTVLSIQNIDFNRPFQKEKHDQQVVSFFLGFAVREAVSLCLDLLLSIRYNGYCKRGMSEYKVFCGELYANQYPGFF